MAELESFSFGDTPELPMNCSSSCLRAKSPRPAGRRAKATKASLSASAGSSRTAEGRPSAILETIELARRRFGDVVAAFAHDEGEGDRSLEDWRQAHTEYFTRRGEFSPDMELYCERFRLVEVLKRE